MRAQDFRFIADMFSKPLDFRGVMKKKYVSQYHTVEEEIY